MRVLVTGSRHWRYRGLIRRTLCQIHPTVVIHGAAPGADTIAGEIAEDLGIPVEVYPADWEAHGKAAGPLRNQRMLDEGRPDLVIAFPLPDSRGTWDMVTRATEAGVPVRIVRPEISR